MKQLVCAFVMMGLLLSAGCIERPDAVSSAATMRRQAMKNYGENMNTIVTSIVDAYRQAERNRIDLLYQADIEAAKTAAAANGGNVNIETAIAGMQKMEAKRQSLYAQVETRCAELQAVVKKAGNDLTIALKLDEAVEEWETTGVTVEAASTAVEKIMAIIAEIKANKE